MLGVGRGDFGGFINPLIGKAYMLPLDMSASLYTSDALNIPDPLNISDPINILDPLNITYPLNISNRSCREILKCVLQSMR